MGRRMHDLSVLALTITTLPPWATADQATNVHPILTRQFHSATKNRSTFRLIEHFQAHLLQH